MDPARPSERLIVFLVGAAQFVNVLDFVIVMPLGPDFAGSLGLPTSSLGLIAGSYTASAALAGVAGVFFLDRLERRAALAISLFGLAVATALAGTAQGVGSLVAARVVAGLFGGPATSVAYSIVADVVPPARRGRAMGAVMGAFSLASIVGVPLGLELARQGSWRLPFFAVGTLGALVSAGVALWMPRLAGHLEAARAAKPWEVLRSLVARPLVRLSYTTTATSMIGGFLIIPNLSAHLQQNLGYPRDRLHLLYAGAGVASFVSMRAAGWLNDRFGAMRTSTAGAVLLVAALFLCFVRPVEALPIAVVFTTFYVALAFRNVSVSTLTSKVPGAAERASFSSLQSAVQHLASAAGMFASAQILVETPDHRLDGVATVALVSMALSAALPVLLGFVERGVARKAT